MPGITSAEVEKISKPRSRAATKEAAEVKPVSLNAVLGVGNKVVIGGEEFEIAPFRLKVVGEASDLLQKCPLVLLAYALSDDEGSIPQIVELLNKLTGRDDEEAITEDATAVQLATLPMHFPGDSAEAMLQVITLAIQRRHPDFTQDQADDLIDTTNILDILRAVFQVNQKLKIRFEKP